MKKGFTMIELIFVIVILGILAAVAIPKLTGVKDDAEATKVVSNLGTFTQEMTTYHAKHNKFPEVTAEADMKKFTNVREIVMNTKTTAGLTKYDYKAGTDTGCIAIETDDANGYVKFTPKTKNASKVCQIAITAAVKNGILDGTVDSDGVVTAVSATTTVYATGGDDSMYKSNGVFTTGS